MWRRQEETFVVDREAGKIIVRKWILGPWLLFITSLPQHEPHMTDWLLDEFRQIRNCWGRRHLREADDWWSGGVNILRPSVSPLPLPSMVKRLKIAKFEKSKWTSVFSLVYVITKLGGKSGQSEFFDGWKCIWIWAESGIFGWYLGHFSH